MQQFAAACVHIHSVALQAPLWMFSHYLHAQRHHLWDRPGGAPQSIIAHAVFALNTAAKVLVLKMYRWWQWDAVSAALASAHLLGRDNVSCGVCSAAMCVAQLIADTKQ